MRRVAFLIIVALALGALAATVPETAQAAPTSAATAVAPLPVSAVAVATVQPIFVEVYANQYYWPVASALSFVDGYTSSWFIRAQCRAGYKCLRIYERTIKSDWAAVTYLWSWGAQIYLNPQRRWQPWSYKIRYLVHEIAHSRYVWEHTYTCTDIMHVRVPCWGTTLPPLRFSDRQRAILWAH